MANPQSSVSEKLVNEPELAPARQARVVAVAGGKGGVGKTIVTTILGAILAENDKSTIVIDLDFGGANLHQALGILTPPCTLSRFIHQNGCSLDDLKLETSVPNLSLVAGTAGTLDAAAVQSWIKRKVYRHIRLLDADYVLLDIGAGNSYNQLDSFNFADLGIIVVTPEPLAIQDAYNFIKLSLFRKIIASFARYPNICSHFRKFFASTPNTASVSMHEILQEAKSQGEIATQILRDAVFSFRPNLIFNMVENSEDYNECYALQIAIKDILKINPRHVGYVRYDDHIRRAAKKMRPDLMFDQKVDAANDLRNIANELFFGVSPANHKVVAKPPSPRNYSEESRDEKEIVCSIQCQLWGQCSMQDGGMLCRIPVIGYVNQKRG